MSPQVEQKVLTRQELYNLAWATPMSRLAEQFKLSDNGLRKICRKYEIPLPEGGYWQKLQYGKPIKKPALRSYKGEDAIVINVFPRTEKPEPSETFTEFIDVPERIVKLHPLVAQTKKHFSSIRNGGGGAAVDALDIRVSQGQSSRAYRLMDTIIKALEERGAKVAIDRKDEWKRFTHALIDGEKVHFGLREALRIEKIEKDPNALWGATQEFVPNGKFELYLSDYLGGLRTKWRDGDKGTLEEKLTSFLNGAWVAAAFLKKRRLERESEKRQEEAARAEQERKHQTLEEEKRKIQILEQQVSSWKKSCEIRSLIRAAIKKQGTNEPDSDFAKWVTWATNYADKIDPLK